MKMWIVIILFIITASGTFIPCCQDSDCCGDQTPVSANHNKHQAEGACSPFFACSTCPGSAEAVKSFSIIKPLLQKQVFKQNRLLFALSTYSSSFWQPPRTC